MKHLRVLIFFPLMLYAQSEYISNSSFGVKGDIVSSFNDKVSGLGSDIGISVSSVFDVGFEYISSSYEQSGKLIYAAYNFKIKNNSLKVLLGYSHISNNSDLNVAGPLLGILFSPKIFENEWICLLPGVGFSMAILSASNENRYSNTDHNISVGLEFNVIPKINKKFYLVLASSLSESISDQKAPMIYSFSFGVLYNIPKQ
jgi:hypothetical protein